MLDVILNEAGGKATGKGLNKSDETVDKPLKSFIKSISWRIIGTLDTMLISYFITGKMTLAVSIGGIELVSKTLLYYFHERLWAHIHRIKLNVKKRSDEKRVRYNEIGRIAEGKINPGIIGNTNITVS
jgi:uncharacterized membrane protein